MTWRWWARRKCRRRGHDWFPNSGPREFLVSGDMCLRCSTMRVLLPWGQCLGGHPLRDHYDERGLLVPHPTCVGPR